MKKTTSYTLEKDLFESIEKYKEEKELTSRSSALERMLLERESLLRENSLMKSILSGKAINLDNNIRTENVQRRKEPTVLEESINDIYSDMPD